MLACLLLAACLTPAQQAEALQAIDGMRAKGIVTPEQYEALRDAILQGGLGSWLSDIGAALGGAVLGYAGVQLRRGPAATAAERQARVAVRRAKVDA